MPENFVFGVDFGTDSVRSVLVDVDNGLELASATYSYPRWASGLYCDPSRNQFRQHPLDHMEGLESTIRECLRKAGPSAASHVKAISVDTTGSSPLAVNESGTPLSLTPGFEENPNAMMVIWKDHVSVKEAAEINAHAGRFPAVNYLKYVGGIYSSEWFWAKLLHILRADKSVRAACYTWVEHCDWIPFLLTGGESAAVIKRSVCAAGHKALWAEEFGGLPPNEFFATLDPLLDGFVDRLFRKTCTAAEPAGRLSAAWSDRLGLSQNVIVGVGAFDAHVGAVGGEIEPYVLSRVMGTSTCDILVAPEEETKDKLIHGICGQVSGSVIPGMTGLEAGQSAFGDAYAWFRNLLLWPLKKTFEDFPLISDEIKEQLFRHSSIRMLDLLGTAAGNLPLEDNSELALDWFNGRRTPDANQNLKGALTQINLATDAPRTFRAIAESTCFGAKAIANRFISEGIPVKGLIGLGGVARKSPFIMQMLADVMNMPIRIHRSEQTCALGAAMFAATVSGIYKNVESAMNAMGQGFDKEYFPDKSRTEIYARRYRKYLALGDAIEKISQINSE